MGIFPVFFPLGCAVLFSNSDMAQYLGNGMRHGAIERRLRSTSFVARDKQTRERGLHESGWSSVAGVALRWNCYRPSHALCQTFPFSSGPRRRRFIPLIAGFATATYVTEYLNLESLVVAELHPSVSPGAPEGHVTAST